MQADLILVGGGLANTLIALRLADAQPELKVLLLEQADTLGGNHTWSFHGGDLTPSQFNWLAPLIQYNWDSYSVQFPNYTRTLPSSYHSITSERLHAVAQTKLAECIHTGTVVSELQADHVVLADGTHLSARAVIDGRGPAPSPHLDVRFQKFVGLVVELAKPHYLSGPIIMDATQTQDDGYRFFYTLPFDAQTLLIEDTRYSDTPDITASEYGDAINLYAADKGWQITRILREEDGVLPITLGGDINAFWDATALVARSGLQAALFQPATGYSLANAMHLADELAQLKHWSATSVYQLTRRASERLWENTGFYRALNRMLFLAADPHERRHILERFYGLNGGLIARFYAGQNTLLDKLRILSGKPPVKLNRAYTAVFNYSTNK
ncbi:MAG: lycopene beta-cyclase CrtY [Gammaproteobacteria bacterium]|nr:lycopene beta-cyclase CrtY [Gammaproteobacteria bacterium]MCP4088371.1 lycopene beta-cyclase CrtY [Gammaproteobacteria bacterium]MCP4275090.1 lycopene beta-cyclase CrtY [Gammaproteobacteria bacterium]MCP4830965.1 lycopene beta-cyclase CrtY [Gammaproteobacteria bacterium]MCP4927514.1 lycopene beta-cyclase CrtY [Gammaproteobacteria bacterium]